MYRKFNVCWQWNFGAIFTLIFTTQGTWLHRPWLPRACRPWWVSRAQALTQPTIDPPIINYQWGQGPLHPPVASVQPFSSWTSLSWNLDCGFRLRAGHLLGLLPGKGRYRGWLFPILSFPDLSSWLWICPVYTEDDNWSSIIWFCKGLPLPVLLCWRSGE